MKKFTKMFLSCAAVATVTAAVATSAMAAEATVKATYGENDGKLTLATTATGTATVLVLDKELSATVADSNILYVDQTANGKFGDDAGVVGLLANSDEEGVALKDGKYYVYVGYYDGDAFKIAKDEFTVGEVVENVLIGDADQDGYVDGGDATSILKYTVDNFVFEKDGEKAADADQDGYVDGGDATAILKYTVDKIDSTNDKVGTYK